MLVRAAAPLAADSLSAAFGGRRSSARDKGVEKVLRTPIAACVLPAREFGGFARAAAVPV
ncbi:MAG: hypothetical protein OXI22_00900 [Defluviicoccus sp.]|nr:hypothetical protein [Defluviicoccus sp.]MDE0382416.1 hypothetical protein [Defluviicoccus sp.]